MSIKHIYRPQSKIDYSSYLYILPAFIFPGSNESFLLRLFRILRIFSILKASKNTEGLRLIIKVFKSKKRKSRQQEKIDLNKETA